MMLKGCAGAAGQGLGLLLWGMLGGAHAHSAMTIPQPRNAIDSDEKVRTVIVWDHYNSLWVSHKRLCGVWAPALGRARASPTAVRALVPHPLEGGRGQGRPKHFRRASRTLPQPPSSR